MRELQFLWKDEFSSSSGGGCPALYALTDVDKACPVGEERGPPRLRGRGRKVEMEPALGPVGSSIRTRSTRGRRPDAEQVSNATLDE